MNKNYFLKKMESIEQVLRDSFIDAGFGHAVDGFIQNLKDEVERNQGRGRPDTKIRYYNIHCRWSFHLINARVENNSIYNFTYKKRSLRNILNWPFKT